MNENTPRNIFKCTVLVLLFILSPYGALAQEEASPNRDEAVAYIQGGDLWVKELPAGEAEQLTADGDITSPRWSFSGEWLAYLNADRLWVHGSGVGIRALEMDGPVNQFVWSPTSDTLAYCSRSGSLWVVSDSDWLAREVVSNAEGDPGTGVVDLSWSPDGEWISYTWWDGLTYQSLRKVAIDNGEPDELYVSHVQEEGATIMAGWSGDGRFILFWQAGVLSASALVDGVPLYAIPAAGGEPVRLADSVLVHPDFVTPRLAGGNQVAVVTGEYRGVWTNKALRLVLPVSGAGETLTPHGLVVSSPVWSPDGQRVVFVAMLDEGDLVTSELIWQGLMGRRIWLGTLNGDSQARQLTHDPAYRDERPLWSADGSRILFARLDENDQASLWLMRADGSELRRVVDELSPAPPWDGYYGHIAWDRYFDWWTESTPADLPVTGKVLPVPLLSLVVGALALLSSLGLMSLRKLVLPAPTSE